MYKVCKKGNVNNFECMWTYYIPVKLLVILRYYIPVKLLVILRVLYCTVQIIDYSWLIGLSISIGAVVSTIMSHYLEFYCWQMKLIKIFALSNWWSSKLKLWYSIMNEKVVLILIHYLIASELYLFDFYVI